MKLLGCVKEIQFMSFEQSELFVNCFSLAGASENLIYKVGKTCLKSSSEHEKHALYVYRGKKCVLESFKLKAENSEHQIILF